MNKTEYSRIRHQSHLGLRKSRCKHQQMALQWSRDIRLRRAALPESSLISAAVWMMTRVVCWAGIVRIAIKESGWALVFPKIITCDMKICPPTFHPRWRLPEMSITLTIAWWPRQFWPPILRSRQSSSRAPRLRTSRCANSFARTLRPEKILCERWGLWNVKRWSKQRIIQVGLTIKPALLIIEALSNCVRSPYTAATKPGTQKSRQSLLRDIKRLESKWWHHANPPPRPCNHQEEEVQETSSHLQ